MATPNDVTALSVAAMTAVNVSELSEKRHESVQTDKLSETSEGVKQDGKKQEGETTWDGRNRTLK